MVTGRSWKGAAAGMTASVPPSDLWRRGDGATPRETVLLWGGCAEGAGWRLEARVSLRSLVGVGVAAVVVMALVMVVLVAEVGENSECGWRFWS